MSRSTGRPLRRWRRAASGAVLLACALVLGGGLEGAPEAVDGEQTLEQRVEAAWSRILGPREGRHEARMELAALGPDAVPLLLRHAEAASWTVRWEFVNALGAIGDPAGIAPLVRRIVEDPNLHVRWRALWALSSAAASDEAARTAMAEAMAQAEPERLRWNAAVGRAYFGDPAVTELLEEGLQSPDDWVRWEAVNGLGQIPGPKTSRRLLPLLEDEESGIRTETAMALGRIGDEPALEALCRLLHHGDHRLRWRAALGLARHRPAACPDRLRRRLEVEEHPEVRSEIRRALGERPAPRGAQQQR